jgi:hypothetical protein
MKDAKDSIYRPVKMKGKELIKRTKELTAIFASSRKTASTKNKNDRIP